MDITRYHAACERALQWCLERQNEDGSIQMEEDCFDGIYKFPAAMVVMGKYVEASKLLAWLENNTLTPQGDFTFPGQKVVFDWHKAFYLYTNSWLVIGAQRAGFFSLAQRAIEYILTYQNPVTGDFQSGPKGVDHSGLHDTTITSNCGIACLHTGRLAAARKAADALCHIVAQQPGDDHVFYFRTDRQGKLVKTFPPDKQLWFCIDCEQPAQLYWYLGISAALLCHMHEISGERRYLEAAERILQFLSRCHEDVLASFASGKVGYAAALLYRITGQSKYKDTAIKFIEWLVKVQKPDGRWTIDRPDFVWFLTYDCTAEFVFWIAEMVRILSAPLHGRAARNR